jgi:hypothetical protein
LEGEIDVYGGKGYFVEGGYPIYLYLCDGSFKNTEKKL